MRHIQNIRNKMKYLLQNDNERLVHLKLKEYSCMYVLIYAHLPICPLPIYIGFSYTENLF